MSSPLEQHVSQRGLRRKRAIWIRYSLRMLMLVVTLVGVVLWVWPAVVRCYRRNQLARYDGIDVRTLDGSRYRDLMTILDGLMPDREEEAAYMGFETWYVWNVAGEGDVIILQVKRLWSSRASSAMRVIVIDAFGNVVRKYEVSTGHRIDIVDASVHVDGPGVSRLHLRTSRTLHGEDIAAQHYSYANRGLKLSRLIDSRGAELRLLGRRGDIGRVLEDKSWGD
jgi:hypothetical protein